MMPTMLRDEVLEKLHRSHIVAKSMEARAKETGLARYDQGPRRTARHAVSLLPASQGQLLELRWNPVTDSLFLLKAPKCPSIPDKGYCCSRRQETQKKPAIGRHFSISVKIWVCPCTTSMATTVWNISNILNMQGLWQYLGCSSNVTNYKDFCNVQL